MSQERLIRRTLTLIILSLLMAFVTYIWFSQLDRSRLIPYQNSPDKDLPSYPIIPPAQFSHEQIHLYRILGNDLPPRHRPGQVLQNLMFILENEPPFPNTKKWWVLNRIVDQEYEDSILELLKRYRQEYVRIPFEVDEYLKRDFRLEDFPEPDFFHSYEYMNFSKVAKLRTIDYTYHDKNLYAMNNNGGRNAALMHGKSQPNARWIMPFDGNCFLTTNGFNEIISQIEKWGDEYKYFLVPMKRLLNNTELLVGSDQRPSTPEEPQIIFRYDAQEMYNKNMRYGRRSKLEMLWRLGVPTPRRMLNKPSVPWEIQDVSYLTPPQKKYKTVGWIFRLFSGQASLEESGMLRAFSRLLAIQDFLDGIDERIARVNQKFNPNRLSLYDEKKLSRARLDYWTGRQEVSKIVDVMIDRANEIVSSIGDRYKLNDALPADSNNLIKFLELKGDRDFEDDVSKSSEKDTSSTSIDGHETVKLSPTNIDPQPEGFHKNEFGQYISTTPTTPPNFSTASLFENVTTLTLAHYFSGNVRYSRWAANLIRSFILSSYGICEQDELTVTSYKNNSDSTNNEGYGFPHLNKIPRIVPKFKRKHDFELNDHSNSSIFPYDLIDTDPSHFLDACRLLYRTKSLTHNEYIDLQQFASLWLEYLINSQEGVGRALQPDHRGTLYDLQVLSLSGFTDDVRLYLRVTNRIRMRIGKQFYVPDEATQILSKISQPYEMIYAKEQIALRKANAYNTAPGTSDEAINSCLIYENEKFRYSSLNLQYWMLTARLIQNVGIGNDLWGYKTKGLKLSTVMMGHMGKYFNRKSTLEYIINNSNINGVRDYNLDEANINEKDDEDSMKTETAGSSGDGVTPQMSSLSFTENDVFILKPLISIAQAAHESDDRRLGIRHEHGDEHDYFQQYIKNFDDKMKLMNENLESIGHKGERKILDNTLGIGKESRERGIPPFWMFGVA